VGSGGVPGGGEGGGDGGEAMIEGGEKVICFGAAIATPAKQLKCYIVELPKKIRSQCVTTYLPKGTDTTQ